MWQAQRWNIGKRRNKGIGSRYTTYPSIPQRLRHEDSTHGYVRIWWWGPCGVHIFNKRCLAYTIFSFLQQKMSTLQLEIRSTHNNMRVPEIDHPTQPTIHWCMNSFKIWSRLLLTIWYWPFKICQFLAKNLLTIEPR